MAIISKVMFPLSNSVKNIQTMKAGYDTLQTQLASGKKASTLAEMGTDRYFDLALRQRMAKIDSYQENIKTVNLRVNVLDSTISRLDTIEADARSAVLSSGGATEALSFQSAPTLAASRLDETFNLLNADVAGRYLFGGSSVETRPVESTGSIIDGSGGKDGFRTIVTQRKAADLGTNNMGRTVVSTSTDTVTIAEDGATHPFGLKLSTISTTSSDISVGSPTGSPKAATIQFGATLPTAGQTVTVGFTLPDGTQDQVVMTATTSANPNPGEFQIGSDAATTAANFQTALTQQVQTLAQGKMVAASAYAAADDFFYGQGGAPMRVDGPPYETATAKVAGTSSNTVFWYKGEDSADPRGTVTSKVGEGTTVKYGVQANEDGFVQLIRTQAAMAVQVFNTNDSTAGTRYAAMVERNSSRLADNSGSGDGSIEMVAIQIGLAKSTTGAVSEQHTAHNAQLSSMLEDIETAPTEEVAMQILALKTRLEASYQVTAMLSQMSLVKYLS